MTLFTSSTATTSLLILLGCCSLFYIGQFLIEQKRTISESSFPLEYSPTTLFALNASEMRESVHELSKPSAWQVTDRPFCTRDQIVEGKWVDTQLEEPPYITPTVHLRCYPKEAYTEGIWNTYKWSPNDKTSRKCEFTKWRSQTFCTMLQQATVMIAGDSLSWEHYSSLVQLLGLHTHQGYQHQSHELQMNVGQTVCDGNTRIVYRRDDKLQNLTAAIAHDFPTVLVLNRGAHYVNDTELLQDIRHNIKEVQTWLYDCEALDVKCHFYWRTSVPGHPHCSANEKPAKSLAEMEARVAEMSNYDNHTINYHWYDYQHQNLLVLKELQASELPYQIIDAYPINMLRPDEHRSHQGDCLHNCYPGKQDVYNQLLLHFLRMERTTQDVDQHIKVSHALGRTVNFTTPYDPDATEAARKVRAGEARR
jgi:hypothetical protein